MLDAAGACRQTDTGRPGATIREDRDNDKVVDAGMAIPDIFRDNEPGAGLMRIVRLTW